MSTASPRPDVDSPASWRVLAGCCIVALFGVTALYGSTFGLMMRPMQQELGWSRADIAFALTLMTLAAPAIMPLVGWLIDNVPLRPLILWGVVLQSASLAGYGLMRGSVWVYYGLCLALIVTATGASMLTLAKLLQAWFDKAFGRALGILFALITVGAVIHPQIVRLVIEHASWREAFFVMGAMSLVFGGAAGLLLVREPAGLRAARAADAPAPGAATVPAAATAPGTMRAFLADRIWWLLAVWNMLFAFAMGAIMLHLAPMMQDRGLSLAQAATALSIVGLGGFVGNLMAGWLVDRVSATRLARVFVLAPLAAAVMLYLGTGVVVALTAAVLLGVFSGGDHSLSVFLARRYFAAETFGRASATQQMATAFGSGISPWLAGLIHDRTGSYDVALAMSIGSFVLAVGAAWLLPEFRGADGPAPHAAGAGAASGAGGA
ncbi:MAG: MFS transporter [Rubrivivax sp.]|nr:MFS transporter [Rubrivivax sp.]